MRVTGLFSDPNSYNGLGTFEYVPLGHVCVCVHICVGTCMWRVNVSVCVCAYGVQGLGSGVFLNLSPLIRERQSLSLEPELSDVVSWAKPAYSRHPSVSAFQGVGLY